MEFKIDTKGVYRIITPLSAVLDDILAGELAQKCQDLEQIGSLNFIVDLETLSDVRPEAAQRLLELHEACYTQNRSLVFTQPTEAVWRFFKENELDQMLNIAPRLAEAIDIVNMEVLERELLSDE